VFHFRLGLENQANTRSCHTLSCHILQHLLLPQVTANRTRLAKPLRFVSSNGKLSSLSDYVKRTKAKQETIFYIAGVPRMKGKQETIFLRELISDVSDALTT